MFRKKYRPEACATVNKYAKRSNEWETGRKHIVETVLAEADDQSAAGKQTDPFSSCKPSGHNPQSEPTGRPTTRRSFPATHAKATIYCTNCGCEVSAAAIACPACGVPPRSQKSFCYNCAAELNPAQIMCVECGVSLESLNSPGKQDKKKEKIVAGILALTLGWAGGHKFYLGHPGAAIVHLVASIIGAFLFGIPLLLIMVISVIEGITYLIKTDEEFQQIYVVNKKTWL